LITYIDYSISEALTYFKTLIINYPVIYYILGALVIFGILILINLGTRNGFIMTFISWIISLILIFYYRGLDMISYIDTIFNIHFYQNIFFYYWNVVVGILIMHFVINSKNDKLSKTFVVISYVLTITGVVYSFYISNIVSNNLMLVVGNIAPIIILGNILLFITYLYLIILKIVEACKRRM